MNRKSKARFGVLTALRRIVSGVSQPLARDRSNWWPRFVASVFAVMVLGCPALSFAQTDRYWSGGSAPNANISLGGNWYSPGAPSSGDNLYFNNTINNGTNVNFNYSPNNFFNFIISYNNGGALTFTGDKIFANKYENNNNPLLLTINQDIANRSGTDFEINPVGSGGIRVNNVDIQDGRTLRIYGGNTLTVNGAITQSGSGNANLEKNQGGTTILNGSNSYAGTTTVNAGILTISHASALGATSAGTTVAAGASLRLSNGITVSGEALTLNGTGQANDGALLSVSGANSYLGAITLGSLSYVGANSGASLVISNVTGGANQLGVVGAGNTTIAGSVSSSGGNQFFKTDTGTATLLGSNTFGGDKFIRQGGVILSNNSALGGAGTIQLGLNGATNNATLLLGQNITNSSAINIEFGAGTKTVSHQETSGTGAQLGSITLNNSSLAFNVTNAGTLLFGGGLTANGTTTNDVNRVAIDGGGTLIVTNNSAGISSNDRYQVRIGNGTLVIGAGTIIARTNVSGLGHGLDLGVDLNGNIVNAASTLRASNGITVSNAIYVSSTSNQARTLGASGASSSVTYSGPVGLNNAALTLDSTNGQSVTLSGAITNFGGTGALTKVGTGTATLTGANTYSGTTTISAGTLSIGSGGSSGDLGTGNVTNNASLIFNRTGSVTWNNLISGTGELTKLGAGTLALTASNTYTGTTTVSSGTLRLNGSGTTLASTNVVINGGTLNYQSSANQQITNAAALSMSSGLLTLGARQQDLASFNMTGGVLTIASGRLTVLGAGTFTGGTVSNTASSAQALRLFGGLVGGGATFVYDDTVSPNSGDGIRLSNSLTYSATNTAALVFSNATANLGRLSLVGSTANSSNNVFDIADVTGLASEVNIDWIVSGTGNSLIKTGAGALTMSASNAFTGGFTLNGGTVRLGNDGGLGTGALTLSNGTIASSTSAARSFSNTVTISGDTTFGDATGTGTLAFTNTATNNLGGGTRTLTTVVDTKIDGALGNGGITKAGAGTLSLSNASSSFGTLTINAGRVAMQTNATITGLGGSGGNLQIAGGTLSANLSADSTYNDVISGSGVLAKSGAATLNLGGANTYSGGTLVSLGALAGDSTSVQGAITNNATVIFNQATNGTYAGVMSGTGALTKNGAGTLNLTSANSYTNATTINAGTLAVSNGAALADTGTVTLSNNAGATFAVNTSETIGSLRGGGATGGNVNLNGSGVTLTVAETGSQTFAGVISNTGGLTKTGAGTMTLSGSNTYTGPTTISAGVLSLGADNVIGDSSVVVINGGTWSLGANAETVDSVNMTSGALLRGGAALTLTTASTFTGGTVTLSSATGQGIVTSNALTLGAVTFDYTANAIADKNTALGLNGNVQTTGSGTTFFLNNNANATPGTVSINLSVGGATSARTFDVVAGTAMDVNWALRSDAAATLIKAGAGTLILRSAASTNGMNGGVTLSNGVLLAGADTALGKGAITLSGGTIASASSTNRVFTNNLSVNGDATFGQATGGTGALTFSSTATNNLGGGTRTLTTLVDTKIDGALGNGSITKAGAGTLSLSNANSSFGGLTINAGRVAIQTNATITGLGGSGGNLQIANGALTANLAANSTYNDVISGGGALAKSGAATLTLGGSNTYSGGTTLSAGVLRVANSSGLGTGTLTQSSGASTLQISNAGTVANNMSVYNVAFISGNNTLSGSLTLNNTTYDVASGTTNTLSGTLDGSGGITKTGTGDLVIAGTTNNTFTGNTDVQAGRLVLSKTAGVTAISSTNTTNGLRIASGAVVELAASNQINNAAGLTLDGGTFLTGSSTAGYAETLGTLTLSSSSIIDFGSWAGGSGSRNLNFADSSGISWTGGLILTNWTQATNSDSGQYARLYFGSNTNALTSTQLGQINFNIAGTLYGAKFLSGGEVVADITPIPEPRVYAAALALFAAVGWRERKRLRGLILRRK